MSKKITLRPCFACWEGWGCKKEKLPRKKKKALKKLYAAFPKSVNYGYFDGVSSCNLKSHYKHWKKAVQLLPFLMGYKRELDFILSGAEGNVEPGLLDANGRLCWHWEYDNDYGGDEGLMPFCYSEAAQGNTWAFDEVVSMLKYLWVYQDYDNRDYNDFIYPAEVTSDATLLKYIRKTYLIQP